MNRLDQLNSWPMSSKDLGEILTREEWRRPSEGLYYEYKGDVSTETQRIPKTVAAFANSEGGFLFIGATARNGVPIAFDGLDPIQEPEPALKVSNILSTIISPVPKWAPLLVPSPSNPGRMVLMIRIDQSALAPHLVGGRVYIRTPGGASEPLRDRASLDRLLDRFQHSERLARARLSEVEETARRLTPGSGWTFSIGVVPLPFGVDRRLGLLSRAGATAAEREFAQGHLLDGPRRLVWREDALEVAFARASVRVYEDGAMEATIGVQGPTSGVDASCIARLVHETLTHLQSRGLQRLLVVCRLKLWSDLRLVSTEAPYKRSEYAPASEWRVSEEVSLSGGEIQRFEGRLDARLWRSAGCETPDPD